MTDPEPPPERSFVGRAWPWVAVGLAAAPWAAGLFAPWVWPAELLSHFRFQWLIGTGAVGVVLLLARRWRPLALCGVVALIYGWPLLGGAVYLGGTGKFAGPGPGVTVVTANVLARNPDAAPLLAYLAAADPDVICLQEVDARWAADLAPLHASHPHRLTVPRPDNFGMAVYSRFPGTLEELDCDGLPLIRAVLDTPAGPLTVLNAHAVPPLRPAHLARRNRQMTRLADLAAAGGPALACGDLNCTPFSPFFGDLLDRGALHDSRGGGRDPPSWRTANPLFALPIDHLLPGGGARLVGLQAGPDVGSDHRPLFGRVYLPPP